MQERYIIYKMNYCFCSVTTHYSLSLALSLSDVDIEFRVSPEDAVLVELYSTWALKILGQARACRYDIVVV